MRLRAGRELWWQRFWNSLPVWARMALIGLDRWINFRFGGDPNETVSRRLARLWREERWEGALGCAILDRFDPGHCQRELDIIDRDKESQ